jgi:5-methylcytosine-specific restriction endonuclease McrA
MVNSDGRPPVPAEIRRRVLVEAGHRCAIPTCRHIDVDVHHIVPWAQCQAHEYDNLIALCPNRHRRADSGDIDRKV